MGPLGSNLGASLVVCPASFRIKLPFHHLSYAEVDHAAPPAIRREISPQPAFLGVLLWRHWPGLPRPWRVRWSVRHVPPSISQFQIRR